MGLFDMFKKKEQAPQPAPDTSFILTIGIANLFMYEKELKEIMGENPWLAKARKIEGKKLFVLAPYEGPCELIPIKPEEHDPNSYRVMVNGRQIGYTPSGADAQIEARLNAGQKTFVKLLGGNYRVYDNGEWITYKSDIKGTISFS